MSLSPLDPNLQNPTILYPSDHIELESIIPPEQSIRIDLDTAILIARTFESVAIAMECHIALGGSVLHRGWSIKDLDLFCYPHNSKLNSTEFIIDHFTTLIPGLVFRLRCSSNPEYPRDAKEVLIFDYTWPGTTIRIDLFLVK